MKANNLSVLLLLSTYLFHTPCAAFLIISPLSRQTNKPTGTIEVFRIVLDSSVVFSARGDVLFIPCQRTEGQNVYFYVLLSSLYFVVESNKLCLADLTFSFSFFIGKGQSSFLFLI